MNAKQIGEQVASNTLHHIDEMYPAMWSGVPKNARTSVRNFIVQQVEAAAADLLERMAWQPIETAPTDGRMAWVYRPLAHMSHDEPMAIKQLIGGNNHCWPSTVPDGAKACNPTDGCCHVTHWMPLPNPPSE